MTQVKCKKCGTIGYSAYEKARCSCGGVCHCHYVGASAGKNSARKIAAHESWLEHPQIKTLVEQLESLSDMASHYFFNTYSSYLKRVKKAPAF